MLTESAKDGVVLGGPGRNIEETGSWRRSTVREIGIGAPDDLRGPLPHHPPCGSAGPFGGLRSRDQSGKPQLVEVAVGEGGAD